MARITVEDCLQQERNRFSLVFLASRRAKQLLSGKNAVTDTRDNKAIVSALREIAVGKVKFGELEESAEDQQAIPGILKLSSSVTDESASDVTAPQTPVSNP